MRLSLYKVKIKSDSGIHYLSIVASSYKQAIIFTMDIEGCPERAIQQITRIKIISE